MNSGVGLYARHGGMSGGRGTVQPDTPRRRNALIFEHAPCRQRAPALSVHLSIELHSLLSGRLAVYECMNLPARVCVCV